MGTSGGGRSSRRVSAAGRLAAVAAILLLAGCSAASVTVSPTIAPSPAPPPTATPAAVPTTSPNSPTTAPKATPSSSAPPDGWSAARPIGAAVACTSVTSPVALVVDGSGGYHVASGCDGRIHYAVSTDAGATWTETVLQPPADRGELDPQLAVDGTTLYLAYTRVGADEGCGSNGTKDLGVWFRSRKLPAGAWSAARQIGQTDDHVDGLRAVNGTLHLVVENAADASGLAYETQAGATYHRYALADASGPSLRVGDDGKARLVYGSGASLRYATFNGTGFTSAPIAGSEEGWGPDLVLGPGDVADVLWDRAPTGGGCVTRDAEAADGTYFATNSGGSWQTSRLTQLVGQASLTLDPGTGQVDAVVSGSDEYDVPAVEGFVFFTRSADGTWASTTLSPTEVESPVIRLDPATGTVLVAYITTATGGSTSQVMFRARP